MRTVIACAAMALLAGCEANNLYVAHNTVVGVNANVSPNRQQGQLLIGYDRDFVAIIPKSVKPVVGGRGEGDKAAEGKAVEGERDVMSLLNCTELEVDGPYLTRYVDKLASGEAAKNFAAALAEEANAKGVIRTEIFDCERDTPNKEDDAAGG